MTGVLDTALYYNSLSVICHMTGVLDTGLGYKVCQWLATWGVLDTRLGYKVCQRLATWWGVLDTALCYNSLSVTCHMTWCTWYSIML
jgi:hypothetical protein